MSEDSSKRMVQLSDEELLEIIQHSKDYIPEYLKAADEELKKRNIPVEKIADIKQNISKLDDVTETKANQPLSWIIRILMFLLSFGLLQVLLYQYYDSRGYKRKGSECWKWMSYGLIFYVVVIVVMMILKRLLK
jgi:hypothetical protein